MITITACTKSTSDSETKMCEKLSKMDEANRKLARQVIYLLKELNARNGEIEALKAELEKVKVKSEVKPEDMAEQNDTENTYARNARIMHKMIALEREAETAKRELEEKCIREAKYKEYLEKNGLEGLYSEWEERLKNERLENENVVLRKDIETLKAELADLRKSLNEEWLTNARHEEAGR
jgi:hypothetical protein